MISSVVNLFNVDSFQNMTVRYGLLMNIWFVSPPMAFDSSGIMHLSSIGNGRNARVLQVFWRDLLRCGHYGCVHVFVAAVFICHGYLFYRLSAV